MRRKRLDITGKKFFRLTAIAPADDRKNITFWLCQCECGRTKEVATADLMRGHTKSCGCYSREMTKLSRQTHGETSNRQVTPEYRIWCGIKARCCNKNSERYKDYGGRGITICDRWINDFDAFLDDMGRRPSNKHSIDRIDNDGNYSPENCRWATIDEQSRNTRVVKRISINGVEKTVYEWASISGVKPKTILARLRLGWATQLAVHSPASKHNKLVTLQRQISH